MRFNNVGDDDEDDNDYGDIRDGEREREWNFTYTGDVWDEYICYIRYNAC